MPGAPSRRAHSLPGDDAAPVDATRGVDQGCPLSPALYAIGTAPALETLLARLRALDPQAAVMAYLDDTYVVVAQEHAGRALALVRELFGPRGLELNLTKTKIWVPNGNTDDLDIDLSDLVASHLPCLGSSITFVTAAMGDAHECAPT